MSYTPTNWKSGDIVTADKLNKIESGVQTAYNERILNVTYGTKTTIVDTTTVSFSKDGNNDWYISAANPISGMTFVEDTLYKVTWDGTEYDCFYIMWRFVSSTLTGTYNCDSVGNIAVIGMDNGYISDAPFFIGKRYKQTESNNIYILTTSSAASHTIKVETVPFTKMLVNKLYYEPTGYNVPAVRIGSGRNTLVVNGGLKASAESSSAFGNGTEATGTASAAFGIASKSTGKGALSEGSGSKATSDAAHAEGCLTTASSYYTHAEGYGTTASSPMSHAEGIRSVASGQVSHAEGEETIANHKNQHTFGAFNVADDSAAAASAKGNYIEIVGNGTADDARSNARTLDWSGNEALAGSLTLGLGTENEVTITAQQLKALLALLE